MWEFLERVGGVGVVVVLVGVIIIGGFYLLTDGFTKWN